MIEEFRLISGGGSVLKPNITPNKGVSLFEYVSDEVYSEYINNSTKGVEWCFSDHQTKIVEDGVSIFGLPTPDKDRIVVIYPMNNDVYCAPNNAVIYNADGSVFIQLHAQEPISELAKTRTRNLAKTKSFNPPHRLYFDGVSWAQVNDKIEIVVRVGFDREWWEERVLNPDTGELGECLSSGRK